MECAADDAGWGQAAGANGGQDSNGKLSNNHVGRAVAVTSYSECHITRAEAQQRKHEGKGEGEGEGDSAWAGVGELQLSALGRGRGASKLGLGGTK